MLGFPGKGENQRQSARVCIWVRFVRLGLSPYGPYPQYGWDFPEEIPEKFRKTPETLSERFSWNFPREYGWDAPNPIIQGI